MDLSELNLSVRDFNAVKRFGVNSVEELIERLPEFCGHAKNAAGRVTEALAECGALPYKIGEWVEPDECGDEIQPEELRPGELVIMGFPTESRDWRKVVLIRKIEDDVLHYLDGSGGYPHGGLGDRHVWRIRQKDEHKPGDYLISYDPEIWGEELTFDQLAQAVGQLVIVNDAWFPEVDTLDEDGDGDVMRVLSAGGDAVTLDNGEPRHEEISRAEIESKRCCTIVWRLKTANNPQSGSNNKEDNNYGNTEDPGNDHTDTDDGAAPVAAECSTSTGADDSTLYFYPGCPCDTCRSYDACAACPGSSPDACDGCTDRDSSACDACADRRSDLCPCSGAISRTRSRPDVCPCSADAGADSAADVLGGAARTGSSSADGERQTRGADRAAHGVRGAVDRSDPGEPQGGLCGTPESDGRTDLMPDVHAKRSPSHASIWGTCTAAPALEAGIPDKGSSYAAEGTLAHAIAELKVLKKFTPMSLTEYKNKLGALKADPLYQPEMDGYTDQYVDEIVKICHAFPSKPYVVAEKRLDMGHIVPDCFGTADCVVLYGSILHIFDFKYGKGVPVSAEKNPQMRLYALGAVKEYSMLGDITLVCTHIIQPRLDHYESEMLSIDVLNAWGDELGRRVSEALITGGSFVPGEHCRFCKAKSICRARAEALLTLEEPKARTEQGETLTDAEIGDVLSRAIALESWVKGLEEYAQDKLLQGGEIPGWKLVEGRSVRTITNTDEAFGVLTSSGYDSDLLYERKPLGLTALEKLCGKKKLTELIGTYITKPAGKPTLAPESDKRKAYSKKKLEEMFKEDK